MISNNLASLIHDGVAKYNTWTVAGTGSCRLPVPSDCYVVITDFHISHFVDRDLLDPAFDFQKALANCAHHLRFKSASDSYMYNLRSPFKMEFFDGIDYLVPNDSETSYDTYQVHTTDVHIDIWRLADFKTWLLSVAKLANKTAEPAGPMGYGTVNNTPSWNVVRQIDLSGAGNAEYIPYGQKQDIALNPGWREQFFSDIDNTTLLFPPDTVAPDGIITFPIVNIGFVLVKQPFDRKKK